MNVDVSIQVPSWNAMYRIANNRMYKTAEAKAFQEAIGWSYSGECFEGDVEVFIEFWRFPLIDTDNCTKIVLDSLEGIAYKNDRQVSSLIVDRYKCKRGEDRLCITINNK